MIDERPPEVARRYHLGQHVRVRGVVWRIEAPLADLEGSSQVLALRNVANQEQTLSVIASVEDVQPLPAPRLGDALADYRRWQDFHRALLCGMQLPPGAIGGVNQTKIVAEDYQLVPVMRAFERPLQRLLIADDVGLGKTIEAMLILQELRARGRGERVLVVCPAGLQDQWADEFRDKLGLEFDVYDSEQVRTVRQQLQLGHNPWAARRRIITSIDYVKRADVKRMLRDVAWDVAVVDEAHYLAESSAAGRTYRTERSRFGEFLAERTDSLILLTATPHTGDRQSLYSLVQLVDPTLIASPEELQSSRIKSVVVRRYKRDINDAKGQPRFRDLHVRTIAVPFADVRERDLYDRVIKYCNRRWKRERDTAVGFAMTVIKKRLISSRHALVRTLEDRLEHLSPETVDVDLRRGVVADLRAGAPLTEEQQNEAERRVIGAPPADEDDRKRERSEIERLLRVARAIPPEIDGKALRLLEELRAFADGTATGKPEKVIVFTEYRDTHAFLLEFLRAHGYTAPIAILTGGMSREARAAEIERFADPTTTLLLATDAASEGLNLQDHCRVVLHYELPWNPNRLEQRNGRVYRWGQREDVIAANLSYDDTYDGRILALLLEKTKAIRDDLGAAADVIGVMSELSWEELLMSTTTVSDSADAVAHARVTIDREVAAARNRLLAWRDSDLGKSDAFTPAEAAEVAARAGREAEARVTAEQRRRLVEWIVPQYGGAVRRLPDGALVLDRIPRALRRDGNETIPLAVFSATEAAGRRNVEVLGTWHPLMAACADAARAALYDGSSPLAAARVAAKIAEAANPGILYTFGVRVLRGDGTTYAEQIVPVFAPVGLPVSRDAAADEALLGAEALPGAVASAHPRVVQLQAVLMAGDRDAAVAEAARRGAGDATRYEREEARRTQRALEDVDRWLVAKEAWLQRQLALPATQMVLAIDEGHAQQRRAETELFERQRRRLQQQLATLDANAAHRRERLAQRGDITAATPELLGALLIIPTYEVAR